MTTLNTLQRLRHEIGKDNELVYWLITAVISEHCLRSPAMVAIDLGYVDAVLERRKSPPASFPESDYWAERVP